jgi:hypothetical protein
MNGYRWNVNALLGKYFLLWRHYAPTSILDVVKQGQLTEGRIIMETTGMMRQQRSIAYRLHKQRLELRAASAVSFNRCLTRR